MPLTLCETMPRRPLSSLSVAVVPILGIGLVACGAGVSEAAFVASSSGHVGFFSSPSSAILPNAASPRFVTNAPRAFAPHMRRDSGAEPSGSGRTQHSPDYSERLREAARSQEAFEKFSLNMMSGDGSDDLSAPNNNGNSESEDAPKTKKKGGYKPIEQWDQELKSKKPSEMTWEEKVSITTSVCIHDTFIVMYLLKPVISRSTCIPLQHHAQVMFDGQRHGNQLRQNDILLRNLHSW